MAEKTTTGTKALSLSVRRWLALANLTTPAHMLHTYRAKRIKDHRHSWPRQECKTTHADMQCRWSGQYEVLHCEPWLMGRAGPVQYVEMHAVFRYRQWAFFGLQDLYFFSIFYFLWEQIDNTREFHVLGT
jgi:hypothetical protein